MQCRILIVEDEWLQAENLEAMLSVNGHSICGVAQSGEEAVALAKRTDPSIVLMDVKLPGAIDGIEAFQRIRRNHPSSRAIFITAYTNPRLMERMEAVGPDAILHKPAAVSDIEEAIATAADRVGRDPIGTVKAGAVST
jgi:DNA-binding NarL/FixJ family response regulator